MVTLVGTQTDFIDALRELLELEYDAVETYTAAINRLNDRDTQQNMSKFKADHERHITEVRELLEKRAVTFNDSPSGKQVLTIGKIAINSLFGDIKILQAMSEVEEDTNKAYERMLEHPQIYAAATDVMKRGLADEKEHKTWILKVIASASQVE